MRGKFSKANTGIFVLVIFIILVDTVLLLLNHTGAAEKVSEILFLILFLGLIFYLINLWVK